MHGYSIGTYTKTVKNFIKRATRNKNNAPAFVGAFLFPQFLKKDVDFAESVCYNIIKLKLGGNLTWIRNTLYFGTMTKCRNVQ